MDIKHFLLLTIVASFSFLILVQGRHRRQLQEYKRYQDIHGFWYVLAGINYFNITANVSCARIFISEDDDGQSLHLHETYKIDGAFVEDISVLNEAEISAGKSRLKIIRFQGGKEIIFQDKIKNDSFLLQSRKSTISKKTFDQFSTLAKGLDSNIVRVNQKRCGWSRLP